jgi:hypothetical protein
MGATTNLRRALKATFIPYVVERGFVVDSRNQPHSTEFRRRAGNVVQIFSVQWEKYGAPRFAVHFGTCPAEGLSVNGTMHAPEDTLPTWLPDSGTLQPGRGAAARSWFRQDASLLQRLMGKPAVRSPSAPIDELLALFLEIEEYWSTGKVGPHIKLWSPQAHTRSSGGL